MLTAEALNAALVFRGLSPVGVEQVGALFAASFPVPRSVGGLAGHYGRVAFATSQRDADRCAADMHGQLRIFLEERESTPYPEIKIAC